MATAYSGRVGAIVTKAIRDFGDSGQDTLQDADCLAWINEAISELAQEGAFIKTDYFDADAGVSEYDLPTELSDYIALNHLSWASLPRPMVAAQSYQIFESWQDQNASGAPLGYFLLADTLLVTPAPSEAVTDGFKAVYEYKPAALTGATGHDAPPTSAARGDQFYVEFILYKAFQRREADTYQRTDSQTDRHRREMERLKAKILGTLTPDTGFAPY